MRFLILIFALIFNLNIAAQSPAVSMLFTEGTKLANENRFDKALEKYKTALFRAENEYLDAGYRAQLRYNIGVCYFRLDRPSLAIGEFKLAILLKKDYTRAHYALAMAELQSKNRRAAIDSFERLLKLDPTDGEAWFDLAFARLGDGDVRSAEIAFVRSIEFGSIDSALSHNNIGVILALRGEFVLAETSFESAIDQSQGSLAEAKRNLEICRTKRLADQRLLAGELRFIERDSLPALAG